MNNMNNNYPRRRRRRRKLTKKQKLIRKIRRNLPLIAIVILIVILAIYGWLIFKIMKSLNNEPEETLIFHTAEQIEQFTMSTELYEMMQCHPAEETKTVEYSNQMTTVSTMREIVVETVSSEPVVQENQPKGFPEYADEVMLLAKVIEIEAGKTREDRIYVGSVMINRARTNYRDFRSVDTIAEVLHQKKPVQQYATATIRKIENCTPTEESLEVARGLIDGSIECLDESVLFQLTYKESWVIGELEDVVLEGAIQYYGRPLDFEQGCK